MRSVHPRVRGEHSPVLIAVFCSFGSSPRTRGTPDELRQNLSVCRFIPAYAGNTFFVDTYPLIVAVHPRVRGEHFPVLW